VEAVREGLLTRWQGRKWSAVASVGHHHTVVWTEEGDIVTCGESSFGGLGHGGKKMARG
jgi:alpha-tubulin suppressor-like RCC1 family protein